MVKSDASVPDIATCGVPLRVSAAVPRFSMVKVVADVEVPTLELPKSKLPAEAMEVDPAFTLISGSGVAVPEPVRLMMYVPSSGSLLEMLMTADFTATVEGLKETVKLVVPA